MEKNHRFIAKAPCPVVQYGGCVHKPSSPAVQKNVSFTIRKGEEIAAKQTA
jgi:hypothetical protein